MPALLILAVTFVLMWVLFILPQQRRVKAHQALLTRLEVGDEVMTTTGMYGTITELDGADVRVEIAPGTVVRLARGAVARRLAEDPIDPPAVASSSPTAAVPAGTAADRAAAASTPDPKDT